MAPGATVANGSIQMNGNVNGKVYARNGHKTNGTHHKVFNLCMKFFHLRLFSIYKRVDNSSEIELLMP
jgi:hypothetical protein